MRFLVLKSKLFDKGEILNEKVDCDNCSKYRGYFGMLIFTRQRKQSVALNKETTAMRAKNTSDLVTDVGDDLTAWSRKQPTKKLEPHLLIFLKAVIKK